jgi:hypothetical protein
MLTVLGSVFLVPHVPGNPGPGDFVIFLVPWPRVSFHIDKTSNY